MRSLRRTKASCLAGLLFCFASGLPAEQQPYAGAASCTACHSAEATTQSKSRHAEALHPMVGSRLSQFFLEAAKSPNGLVRYTAVEWKLALRALNGPS